jgi:hypothetical protein
VSCAGCRGCAGSCPGACPGARGPCAAPTTAGLRGLPNRPRPARDEQQLWHPPCPVYPDEAGALAATFPRNQHIHEIRSSRAQVMAAHRGRSGEQAAPAPSSRTGRRSAPAPHRAPASQYARAPSIRPTGPKRTTAMPHRRGPDHGNVTSPWFGGADRRCWRDRRGAWGRRDVSRRSRLGVAAPPPSIGAGGRAHLLGAPPNEESRQGGRGGGPGRGCGVGLEV